MNTTKLRTKALESFIKCFNLCYPNWEIDGNSSQPLTEEYVEYTHCKTSSKYLARLKWWPDGRIKFAIDSSWYEEATPGERLGLLIHEISHAKVSNHPPEFWEEAVENYRTLIRNHSHEVERVMMGTLEWKKTREFLVTDPLPVSVDHRSEITCERRLAIAKALDYPLEEFEPFENMHLKIRNRYSRMYTEVPIWNIIYEQKSISDLIECFHERPRTHVEKHKNTFFIERPVVKQRGDAYEVVEGDERVALAAHIGETAIQCNVVEEESAEKVQKRANSQSGTPA